MGIFVGLKVSKEDLDMIKKFQEHINLSHPIKEEDIHCTLFSSNEDCNYVVEDNNFPIRVTDLKLGKIKTQSGVDCLALFFESMELQDKYNSIKEKYNITSLYPTLLLHITLSYDCGEIDINNIDLNAHIPKIDMISEYVETLKFTINQRLKTRD